MRKVAIVLKFTMFSIVVFVSRIAWADLIIAPDSVTASSEFTAGFDGAAINTINGSGLPGAFTLSSSHAAYASGNHWTTTGGNPVGEFIVWSFASPKLLSAMHVWNHQSSPNADNPGYDVTQFDLTLLDSSSNVLLALNNVALAPDTSIAQTFNFGVNVANVSSVRFVIDSTQSSPSFTGLGEVRFTAVPEPSSMGLCAIVACIGLMTRRRLRYSCKMNIANQ